MGFPTWRYRMANNGKMSSRIFDSDEIPPGWVDSPAKVKPLGEGARKPKKAKNEA